MVKRALAVVTTLLLVASLTACGNNSDSEASLVVYSGRSQEFIEPFFERFSEESGIKIEVRYGDSAALAAQILEEGSNSPADLFLSQDAGALGAVAEAGLLADLSAEIMASVPARFASADSKWVGLTGRARVFAYSPERVRELPTSYLDVTDPRYKGRVGIAPTNSSFQAFVTALRLANGESATERWLRSLITNEVKYYEKNSMIVEAIEKGEIDLGLVNHYYIFEVAKALGRDISVKDGFFANGDLGNMINVSGAAILASSQKLRGTKKATSQRNPSIPHSSTQNFISLIIALRSSGFLKLSWATSVQSHGVTILPVLSCTYQSGCSVTQG